MHPGNTHTEEYCAALHPRAEGPPPLTLLRAGLPSILLLGSVQTQPGQFQPTLPDSALLCHPWCQRVLGLLYFSPPSCVVSLLFS